MLTDFARHVAEGLAAPQAYLSSRFIYDERGSALFREIMALDEYYLTRAETEILTREAGALVRLFGGDGGRRPVEIVELGAGDGSKTELLLREGLRQNVPLTYRPVDISGDILRVLTGRLADRLPALRVDPIEATYDAALARLRASATRPGGAWAPRAPTRRGSRAASCCSSAATSATSTTPRRGRSARGSSARCGRATCS